MANSQRIIRGAACILILTLFPVSRILADDKYIKSEVPVFPAVQADRALVYFARTEFQRLIPLQTFRVFVDGTPAGWLPQRSYLAVHVDPGRRLVWGPPQNEPQRFEFAAGRTYLLVLAERYGPPPNKILYETSWISGDPADVRGLVTVRKLSYVTSTEQGTAKLREEGTKEFEKERKKTPDVAPPTLPATFETVWYRPGKRGFSFKAYDATGVLTVSNQTIEFKSDKKTLVIPVKDIQAVSLDKVTSAANFADPNLWGIVRFSAAGSTEVAAFRDGHGLGTGGDTERIYLTLQSVVQSTPLSSMPQSTTAHVLPEEQVVVNFDQRKWHLGHTAEKGGQRIKEFVLPGENVNNWTELVTVQSFLGAQKRMTAEEIVLGMKQQLNECPKAMWRIIQGDNDEFLYEWQTVDCPGWDNQYELAKVIRGQTAIHRVAYANRKLPISEETRRQWTHLVGQASSPAPSSVVQLTEVSTPQQPEKATAVPEEFVVYEGLKDQFTIAIPSGWAAYNQTQVLQGAPGPFGIVIFLPATAAQVLKESQSQRFKPGSSESELKEGLRKVLEVMQKFDSGEIPSFLVERVRADSGMSCSGFSEKAEKKLLKGIGRDPIFGKGRKVLEPPHAEPTSVAGCRGLRIRGRGQSSAGVESVVDIYAASDGETFYLFTVRPLAEYYDKNAEVFQKAVSTAKLAAVK